MQHGSKDAQHGDRDRFNTYIPGYRTAGMTLVAQDRLRKFATDLLLGAGATESNARAVADSLVRADLRGHGSHGVIREG